MDSAGYWKGSWATVEWMRRGAQDWATIVIYSTLTSIVCTCYISFDKAQDSHHSFFWYNFARLHKEKAVLNLYGTSARGLGKQEGVSAA